ncbi:hypothetical protein [Haloarchaeobius amylolyticus]|uniref:hypothetical protein n=1 Tax=Haloarchaeobius amylolyticus TaxID=1198296 RepID=UPI00226E7CF2|nr:hypothetical protein [Haloarchaeobius amylolyticus]
MNVESSGIGYRHLPSKGLTDRHVVDVNERVPAAGMTLARRDSSGERASRVACRVRILRVDMAAWELVFPIQSVDRFGRKGITEFDRRIETRYAGDATGEPPADHAAEAGF